MEGGGHEERLGIHGNHEVQHSMMHGARAFLHKMRSDGVYSCRAI